MIKPDTFNKKPCKRKLASAAGKNQAVQSHRTHGLLNTLNFATSPNVCQRQDRNGSSGQEQRYLCHSMEGSCADIISRGFPRFMVSQMTHSTLVSSKICLSWTFKCSTSQICDVLTPTRHCERCQRKSHAASQFGSPSLHDLPLCARSSSWRPRGRC